MLAFFDARSLVMRSRYPLWRNASMGSRGKALGHAPCLNRGPDIGGKGILQQRLRAHQITFFLRGRKLRVIHQSGLGEQLLRHGHGLNHGFDLAFEVVTLVDHVGDVGCAAGFPFEEADLVEDAEYLIWIDRSQGQIVVGVAAIVEMKPSQHVSDEQPGHDLLDILRRIVMSGIDQHFGLRAGCASKEQRHAPVGNVGVIERGLKRLVFHQQALLRR